MATPLVAPRPPRPLALVWRLPHWALRYAATAGGAIAIVALGVLLARAPLPLGIALIGGAIGLVAIVLRPMIGLCVLAFAIPFGSLREISVAGASIGLGQVLALATMGAWLLRRAAFRDDPQGRAPSGSRAMIGWALAAYLGALLVSLWPAQNVPLAAKEIAKWVEFAALFVVVSDGQRAGEARALVAALLCAGALQGLLGAYQFVRQVGPPGFVLYGRFMRAYGTFDQPNPYAGYLGLLLPLAYGTVVAAWREAWPSSGRRSTSALLLWGMAAASGVAMAAGLVMSWSRGALLGAAAGAALVLLALGRRVWLALAVVALVAAVATAGMPTLLPASLTTRLTEAVEYLGMRDVTAVEVNDANFSSIERLAHWRAAWLMFAGAPWLGVGAGQYAAVYPSVAVPRWSDPLGHAHNVLLNVMAEGGLLSLAAYLGLMGAALWTTWRVARAARGWRRGIALGALGMMGHLVAHNMVDNLYVHEMYLLVAMLLGLAAALGGTRDAAGAPCRSMD